MTIKHVYKKVLNWNEEFSAQTIFANCSTPTREYIKLFGTYCGKILSGNIYLLKNDICIWQRTVGDITQPECLAYMSIKVVDSNLSFAANFENHSLYITKNNTIPNDTILVIYLECENVNISITISSNTIEGTNGISYSIGLDEDNSFQLVKQAHFNMYSHKVQQNETKDLIDVNGGKLDEESI